MSRRPARTAVLALSTAALVTTSIGGTGTATAAQDALSTVNVVAKHWQIVELGLPDLHVAQGRKVK